MPVFVAQLTIQGGLVTPDKFQRGSDNAKGIANEVSSTDLNSRLVEAVQLHQTGQLALAEACYREILSVDSQHVDALHLLGVVAHQTGRIDLSIDLIQRALTQRPDFAHAHYNLGNAYRDHHQPEQAAASYGRAVQLAPQMAEAWANLGNVLRSEGQIQKAIDCYRRAIEHRPDYPDAHNNLGAALLDLGQSDEATASCQAAVNLQPDLAEAHSNLGNALKNQGKSKEAIASYRRALELQPQLAGVHNNLGIVFRGLESLDQAVACFQQALQLQPDFAEGYHNLGGVYQDQGKLEEAVRCYRTALELKPDYVAAHNCLGGAMIAQGKIDEGVASVRHALQLDPDYADGHLHLAFGMLAHGNFADGWKEYEWRWKTSQLPHREFDRPLWDGKPLRDGTILVHAEQGLGDTLQFVRYLTLVRQHAGQVIFECPQSLTPLVNSIGSVAQVTRSGDALPDFDAHAPLMSLPRILQTTLSTIPDNVPYLAADSGLIDRWAERLESYEGLKIAICWRGNPKRSQGRAIPLQAFGSLAAIEGVNLFSLQKEADSDRQELSSRVPVITFGQELDEASGPFMDSAAIMMNVDLVVTCCTSIAHLAGALGVPTWVGLSYAAEWRWLRDRTDSPWYPSMRLFRQSRLGEWTEVFERMASALRAREFPPDLAQRL